MVLVSKAIIRSFFLAILFVLTTQKATAQMVGPDNYIQGTSLELGVNGAGGFEGVDQTVSPPPTGYHARDTFAPFGFIADPLVDSWAVYDGDFYTPGTPENGWGIQIDSTGRTASNNYFMDLPPYSGNRIDIPGSIIAASHILDCYNTNWEGHDTVDGTNLHISINYLLHQPDLYYTTTVSITNNTSNTISDMYYYRNLDPDNNETVPGGSFTTNNTIVSEPTSGTCGLAHVSATSNQPTTQPTSYIGLAGVGANFRVCYGGFSNRVAHDMWRGGVTGSGTFTQTVGSSDFADEGISLSYRIQNLAPGATETFKFVVILSDSAASNAINNLLYLSYAGSSGSAGSPVSSCNPDTVRTCGAPVTIGVGGEAVGDFTWAWSPTTGLSSSTAPSVTANPPVTTSYTVIGTPTSVCASIPAIINVVVQVTPSEGNNPYITPVPVQCAGNPPITLTVDSIGGVWSGPGITDDSLGIFDPSVGAGTYLISYTTPGYCNTTDTVSIIVYPVVVTITQPPVLCIGTPPVTLIASAPGGTWTGTGITDASLGTFDQNLTGAGNFTITYTIPGICPLQDTVVITVDSVFDPTINPHLLICKNEPAFNFTAAHLGGSWSGLGITSPTLGTFNPVTAGVGTHIITYTFAGPCGSSDTTIITVLPIPDPTITNVDLKCINSGPFNMIAASPGGVWSGTGITDSITGTFNPAIAGAGIHTVMYAIPGRCPAFDTALVNVIPLPVLSIITDTTEGCPATTINFTGITDQPGGHYSWDFGDGSTLTDTSSSVNPTYIYKYAGSYSVTFTYTNTTGCVNNIIKASLVTVHPQPVGLFEITPKPVSILTPTVNFLDQSTGLVNAWLWDFGTYGTSILQNPTVVYADTGSFAVQLIVTSIYGCLDTVTDNAYVNPEYLFYAPNAFTPDGDGNNDVFKIYGNEIDHNAFEMNIFDRYGERLFRTTDINEGWNGAKNNSGKIAEQGVYVYRIVLKDHTGIKHEYIGHVTIVR